MLVKLAGISSAFMARERCMTGKQEQSSFGSGLLPWMAEKGL